MASHQLHIKLLPSQNRETNISMIRMIIRGHYKVELQQVHRLSWLVFLVKQEVTELATFNQPYHQSKFYQNPQTGKEKAYNFIHSYDQRLIRTSKISMAKHLCKRHCGNSSGLLKKYHNFHHPWHQTHQTDYKNKHHTVKK